MMWRKRQERLIGSTSRGTSSGVWRRNCAREGEWRRSSGGKGVTMDDPASATVESGASDWEKAVQSGHCPICFLLQQDEFHRVCRWVGGDIADEGNRRGLDEAGGFCNWHFWLLNEIHSPQSGSGVDDYIAARLGEGV